MTAVLDLDTRTLSVGDITVRFTNKEVQVLRAISEGHQDTKAITDWVYPQSKVDNGHIVRVLISRIRKKLKEVGLEDLLNAIYGKSIWLTQPIVFQTSRPRDLLIPADLVDDLRVIIDATTQPVPERLRRIIGDQIPPAPVA